MELIDFRKANLDHLVIIRTSPDRFFNFCDVVLCLYAQEFQEFNIICVVNSKDKTQKEKYINLIKGYSERFVDRWCFVFTNQKFSRGKSLNIALEFAKEIQYTVLDDDDHVFDNWTVNLFDSHYDLVLVKGYSRFYTDSRSLSLIEKIYDFNFNRKILHVTNFYPIHSYSLSVHQVKLLGGYDENLPFLEDYDMLLRYSIDGLHVKHQSTKKMCYIYNFRTQHYDSDELQLLSKTREAIQKKYNLLQETELFEIISSYEKLAHENSKLRKMLELSSNQVRIEKLTLLQFKNRRAIRILTKLFH